MRKISPQYDIDHSGTGFLGVYWLRSMFYGVNPGSRHCPSPAGATRPRICRSPSRLRLIARAFLVD